MKKPIIAIVNSSSFGQLFPEHMKELQKIGEVLRITVPKDISDENLTDKLKNVNGIIATVNPKYTENVLKKLKNLAVISRHGTNIDNIDINAATRNGIIVCKVPGEFSKEAMAEHTVSLILGVSRKLIGAYFSMLRAAWGKRTNLIGTELKNKRIGLFGIGNVGSRVTEILTKGFHAEVFAHDPLLSNKEIEKRGAVPESFENILKHCDIISFHCPLTSETKYMIKKEQFLKMKNGVILINTANGELIEEKALLEAVKSGKVAGFGADVLENEPITKAHPFLKFDNILITPYIGLYTHASIKKMGDSMVDTMKKVFIEKKFPKNIVNKDLIPRGIRKIH
jgi:phosphoglycerate dehydrogenase-like enzyme